MQTNSTVLYMVLKIPVRISGNIVKSLYQIITGVVFNVIQYNLDILLNPHSKSTFYITFNFKFVTNLYCC